MNSKQVIFVLDGARSFGQLAIFVKSFWNEALSCNFKILYYTLKDTSVCFFCPEYFLEPVKPFKFQLKMCFVVEHLDI